MGFGHSSRLHTAKILRLSEDLPLVVEIVDSEEMINRFLNVIDGMMQSGLITLEKVRVLQYGLPPANLRGQRSWSGQPLFRPYPPHFSARLSKLWKH
jgi:hypothetical protein